ncbi:MAG: glycosyltransferase family 2 protein [Phycisphaerae bacterium]|nr:glycosyltransferase family 2 protein [Phycisphaerae bacterium]
MKIAVAICTANRPEALLAALASCFDQARPPDEILVIDDGRLDDHLLANWRRRAEAQSVRLLHHRKPPERRGLTRSRNLALELAESPVIFFLDDDAQLHRDALAYLELVFNLDVDRQIAGADFPIVEAARQKIGRQVIEQLYRYAGLWSVLRRYHRPGPLGGKLGRLSFLEQTPDLQGGALAARVRTLREVGGFDERLPGHGMGEDKEISARLYRRGRLVRITACPVHHFSHPGGRENAVQSGRETVYNYLRINIRAFPIGVGEALMLAWTVGGLFAIELAFAMAGDRAFHRGQLRGMAIGLWDWVRGR